MTTTEVPQPDIPQILSQAVQLHQAGQLQEARSLYLSVLEHEPLQPDAHYNLGLLALQNQNPMGAADHFQSALQANPNEIRYWLNGAIAMMQAGLPDTARSLLLLGQSRGMASNAVETLLQRLPALAFPSVPTAKAAAPNHQTANQLLDLHRAGRHAELEAAARRVTIDFPLYSFGWTMLGAALKGQARLDEALSQFQKVVQLAPLDAQALNHLGDALNLLGRLDEAEINLRQALFLNPQYPDAHRNRGRNFFHMHELDLAEASCLHAIHLDRDFADAHNTLAIVYNEQGRLLLAMQHACRAIELNPSSIAAHNTLGTSLQNMGKFDAAAAAYKKALAIRPHDAATHHNLLFALNYHPDKTAECIFQAYRDFDAHVGLPCVPLQRSHQNDRNASRRLKVGYVSPDFRQHAVCHFLEPVLAQHAAEAVEIFAYADVLREDMATVRLRGYVNHWVPTQGIPDEALAERIRADGIDVLVDLAGHTGHNRLAVFARKPAPVSVSWLGFGYTTGLTAIDYFLTDQTAAPAGSEPLFSETPWRLPTTAYVYRPREGMGDVSPLPALKNGVVTFGTLTRSIRINHRTIRVWSAILQRVPGARLVIDSGSFSDPGVQQEMRDQFTALGVAPDRLLIGYTSPPWDVLRSIDIGLDCFPHNSGTTLFETLYMGLPYVTLAGRPSVGRIGSAILQEAGHPEWIATSEDEYIEKACALAADLPALAKIRAALRGQMQASALMDEVGFTRRLEAAYRDMFALWAAKTPLNGA